MKRLWSQAQEFLSVRLIANRQWETGPRKSGIYIHGAVLRFCVTFCFGCRIERKSRNEKNAKRRLGQFDGGIPKFRERRTLSTPASVSSSMRSNSYISAGAAPPTSGLEAHVAKIAETTQYLGPISYGAFSQWTKKTENPHESSAGG